MTIPVTVGGNTVTVADDSDTTAFETPKHIAVKSNDTTSSGQALDDPTDISTPGHGTAVVGPGGTIIYTPDDGFSGTDTFEYRICDTSNPTTFCATDAATVTVVVHNAFTPRTAVTTGVTVG